MPGTIGRSVTTWISPPGSIGEAAIQAGNSEAIIRKHYLDLKTTKEAEAFFGIMPKKAVGAAEREKTETTLVAA